VQAWVELTSRCSLPLCTGRGFGPGGFGYVRFALVQPAVVLAACAARIGAFLQDGLAPPLRGSPTDPPVLCAAAAGQGDAEEDAGDLTCGPTTPREACEEPLQDAPSQAMSDVDAPPSDVEAGGPSGACTAPWVLKTGVQRTEVAPVDLWRGFGAWVTI